MKTFYFFICLTSFSLNVAGQAFDSNNCNFLGPLHFKNGVAKVTIRAFCYDFNEDNFPDDILKLSKQGKLKFSDYYTRFKETGDGGTIIRFIPDGCSSVQFATIKKHTNISTASLAKYLRLECTVFENFKSKSSNPFFVITKATMLQTDNPVQQIAPFQRVARLNDTSEYSFFGNDTQVITKAEAPLVLDSKQIAYVKTKEGKILPFKHDRRTLTPNGYIDFFSNANGFIELKVDRIVSVFTHSTCRFGHLTIKLKNQELSTDVYGDDRERDKFNGY